MSGVRAAAVGGRGGGGGDGRGGDNGGRGDDGGDRISDRRQRRLHIGRLESLAALAGGICHELSNLAASATMSVQLLESVCNDEASRTVLTALDQLARRVQHAGRQLHWLARGVAGGPTTLQPQYLLADLQKLLTVAFQPVQPSQRSQPPSIGVITRYPPDLRPVTADPLLLFQLLLALALEARDHLAPGGTLVLAARNEDPASGEAQVILEVEISPASAARRPPRRRPSLESLAQVNAARLERLAAPTAPTTAGGARLYAGRRAYLLAATLTT